MFVIYLEKSDDLMQAQDRLNQNPSNSSKPPSSRPTWDRSIDKDSETPEDAFSDSNNDEEPPNNSSNGGETGSSQPDGSNSESIKKKEKRKPGKQPGAKGFGRTQKLTDNATIFL